jgi:hypothetical protein
MRRWLGQIRLVVADNAGVLAAVLLAVAALGGVGSYTTHADPGTEIEQRAVSSWSSTATYTHEATVQTETDVFEQGEVLTGRSAYLQSIAPVLNGTLQYNYDASAESSLTANARLTLVLRSVGENTVFWRDERTLTTRTVDRLGPGEQFSVPFSVNITAQQQRIERIEEQLGGTPGETELAVQSQLRLTGQRNGVAVNETIQHGLSIQTSGGTYSVSADGPATDSGRQIERTAVTASYGPLRSVGAPALVVLAVVCLAALAVGKVTGWTTVPERERTWVAFQSERQTLDEWITQGTIPPDASADRVVTVDSLEGLVDVAIDSNRRVLEDESRELFAVLLEETTYRYEPPSPPTREGLLATPGTTDQTTDGAEAIPDGEGNDPDADAEESDAHSSQ